MKSSSESLLRRIQDEAVSGDCDLAGVLRRCKVLAARLDSRVLQDWIRWESDGYPNDVTLPEYRVLHGRVLGHFSGPFGSGLRNAEIPTSNIPEELREFCTVYRATESIHAVEELLASSKGILQVPIRADAVRFFADNVYVGMHCIGAWMMLSSTQLVEIVNAVRNKVLDFALQIERLDPRAGDVEPGKAMLPKNVVNQVFQTTVYGGVASVVGSASEIVTVNAVVVGDFETLRNALHRVGVPADAVDELKSVLQEEPKPQANGKFGSRVSTWMGKMVSKAAEGTWNIATSVAAETLSSVLRAYYGLGGS